MIVTFKYKPFLQEAYKPFKGKLLDIIEGPITTHFKVQLKKGPTQFLLSRVSEKDKQYLTDCFKAELEFRRICDTTRLEEHQAA